MSNWVSITAADFADDGWFSSPRIAEIHPAYRESTPTGYEVSPTSAKHHSASTTTSESDSHREPEVFGILPRFANMDIEGGGDKIALPVEYHGGGLIPVYEEESDTVYQKPSNLHRRQYSEKRPSTPRYVLFPPPQENYRDLPPLPQRVPSSSSSQMSIQTSRAEWLAQQSQNRVQYTSQSRPEMFRDSSWDMQPDNAYAINQAHQSSPPLRQSQFPTPHRSVTAPQFSDQYMARHHSHATSVDNASLPSLSHWSSESDHDSSAKKVKSPKKTKTLPMNSFKKLLRGSQPLIEASKVGDYNEVLRLLAPGPQTHPISAADRDGFTALHHACRLGYREVAHALLLRQADVEARTKAQDRTPLYFAVHAGHADIVIDLIQNNAKIDAVSKMDGSTALHKASQQGFEEIMRLLIAAGADVNQKDVEGMPPLMWATQGKKVEAARLLINSGANLEIRIKLGANLEASSREGLTVLQKAVNASDKRFASLFLEMGANPNALGPHGMRPLHKAASKGDVELCSLIIGAGGEVGTRTGDGWTPLHFAARYGHKEVAQLLIKKGCEPMVQNGSGETAKELAERYGHEDLV